MKRARGFNLPTGDIEVQRLLEISGAWDIIKEFPLQMEQRIGTGGVTLSGGTEQCLFIARGLVKEPAMLMLDEATSAMDTRTQKRVAHGIREEQQRLGFSVVQVAHRIETLAGSDVLFFVENGQVVEEGGLSSLNGSALEELVAREVQHTTAINPETGKTEERLCSGFYRLLHEAYYDLDFHTMGLSQLLKKVRSLEEQLVRAQQAKESKLQPLLAKLPEMQKRPQRVAVDDAALGKMLELVPPPLDCIRASTAPGTSILGEGSVQVCLAQLAEMLPKLLGSHAEGADEASRDDKPEVAPPPLEFLRSISVPSPEMPLLQLERAGSA